MNKKVFNLIKISLGIVILLILFYKLGINEVLGKLKVINFWFLIPIYLLILVSILFSTTGMFVLLKPLKRKIPFSTLYRYISVSWAIGLFFPGKVGELSLLYFFKKHKINIGTGGSVWLIDKIISVFVIGVLSIIGFLIFFGKSQTLLLVIALVLLFALIFGFMGSAKLRKLVEKIVLRKYAVHFKGFSKNFFSYFKEHRGALLINLLVTSARTILDSFMIFLMFLSFKAVIPLFYILLIWAIEVIVSLIPITPSGSGIKQSVGAYLYSIIGVALPVIGARYVIELVVRYTTGLVFILTTKRKAVIK